MLVSDLLKCEAKLVFYLNTCYFCVCVYFVANFLLLASPKFLHKNDSTTYLNFDFEEKRREN